MKNGRCHLHGGKSTGAPKGNRNAWKHGLYSRDSKAGGTTVAVGDGFTEGVPHMSRDFTEADYRKRHGELTRRLRQAEEARKAAALNAATGEGTAEAHREARDMVQEFKEQLEELDVAIEAQRARDAAAKVQAHLEAYAAAENEMEELAKASLSDAEEFEKLREAAQGFVERYRQRNAAAQSILSRFRVPAGRRKEHIEGLRSFNMTAGARISELQELVAKLGDAQAQIERLGGLSRSALSDLRPEEAREIAL